MYSFIKIKKGHFSDMTFDRKLVFHLAKPYTNCDLKKDVIYATDSYLYNLIYHSSFDYTQQFCYNQCKY